MKESCMNVKKSFTLETAFLMTTIYLERMLVTVVPRCPLIAQPVLKLSNNSLTLSIVALDKASQNLTRFY